MFICRDREAHLVFSLFTMFCNLVTALIMSIFTNGRMHNLQLSTEKAVKCLPHLSPPSPYGKCRRCEQQSVLWFAEHISNSQRGYTGQSDTYWGFASRSFIPHQPSTKWGNCIAYVFIAGLSPSLIIINCFTH